MQSDDFYEGAFVASDGNKEEDKPLSLLDQFLNSSGNDDVWVSPRQKNVSIEKGISGIEGVGSKQRGVGFDKKASKYISLELASPYHDIKALFEVYDKDSTNFAAIQSKVAHVVRQDYDLVESDSFGAEVEKHNSNGNEKKVKKAREMFVQGRPELRKYLDSLSGQFEILDIIEKVLLDLEICGNGYFEVGRNATGQIKYVGHVKASTIRVRENRDGFVQIAGGKHVFFRNFGDQQGEVPLGTDQNPNELIHIQKFTPNDQYYGAPDYISAVKAMTGNNLAQNYNIDFFDNKAIPRHLVQLKGDGFGPTHVKKIINFMEDIKGSNHRVMVIPIRGDTEQNKNEMKVDALEPDSQDFSFREYLKSNDDIILKSHRTPTTKIGTAEGVDMAAVRDGDKNYKENVIFPLDIMLERKLNLILDEIAPYYSWRFRRQSVNTAIEESTIHSSMYRDSAMTPNERRKIAGYPSYDGGDKFFYEIESEEKQKEMENNIAGNRTRDTERLNNKTDSVDRNRNQSGDGRAQE